MLFIFSCKEKADGYNLEQSSYEDISVRTVESSKDSSIPKPTSDFIYTTTTATIDKDTVYSSSTKTGEYYNLK